MTDSAGDSGSDAQAPGVGVSGLGAPDGMQLLAHDIRSAVSDVIGGVRLMDRDTLPDDALQQLDRVQAASELLARLVEELLGGTPRDTVGLVGNLNLNRFLDDEVRRWQSHKGPCREPSRHCADKPSASAPDRVEPDGQCTAPCRRRSRHAGRGAV